VVPDASSGTGWRHRVRCPRRCQFPSPANKRAVPIPEDDEKRRR
jgi:hypothetical protein